MTLTPGSPTVPPPVGACIFCGGTGGQDFVDNILLFVPFAFFLRLAGVRGWRVLAAAVAATVVIETMQLSVIPGRDASLGDVLSNSLGGLVGLLLADRGRALLFPAPLAARRLAIGTALGWLGVLGVTGWALHPSLLRGRPAIVQWAPRNPRWARFHGVVRDAALDGHTIPAGPLRFGSAADDHVHLAAVVENGNVRPSFAPIVRVAAPGGPDGEDEIVALGEDGCDLALHARMRASDLRLRSPTVTVPRVFPCGDASDAARGVAEGDTMALAGAADAAGRMWVAASRRSAGGAKAEEHMEVLRLAPTLGWSFFLPWNYPFGRRAHWYLTALWLGGLLLPAGYWTARGWGARGRRRATMVGVGGGLVALLVACGLVAVPALSGLAWGGWTDWLASLAGAGLGALAGLRSLRPARAVEPAVMQPVARSEPG